MEPVQQAPPCRDAVRADLPPQRQLPVAHQALFAGRYGEAVIPAERVIDPGPIPYTNIELYLDPDLEHALREEGLDPTVTTYRLIEMPLRSISDTASMPWPRMSTIYVDAIKSGQQFPPVVVLRNPHGYWLLDGVNRTQAHWILGTETIRAYELILTEHDTGTS
jgi:hypothetical protein